MFAIRRDKKSEIYGHIREMRKEKLELTEKRREIDRGSRTNSKRIKLSSKNKFSASRECKEDLNLNKRVIIKNDGRYLIYYDF